MKANLKTLKSLYPVKDGMTAIYEAISNSLHALNAAPSTTKKAITITVVREGELLEKKNSPILEIIIHDNGIGFNADNLDSFCEFGSEYKNKIGIGGKGIGRISWLNIFQDITIESVYQENGTANKVDITFDESFTREKVKFAEFPEKAHFTILKLKNLKNGLSLPARPAYFRYQIIEHFLDLFINNSNEYTIQVDDDDSTELFDYFEKEIKRSQETFDEVVNNIKFTYYIVQADKKSTMDDKIIFFANNRGVREFKLEDFIKDINNVEKKYVYLIAIKSEFLNNTVNSLRSDFEGISSEKNSAQLSLLASPITYENIIAPVLPKILKALEQELSRIKDIKKNKIEKYIREDAPQYMYILKNLKTSLDDIKLSELDTDEKLETKFHKIAYNEHVKVKNETLKALKNFKEKNDQKKYLTDIENIIDQYSAINQSELARYIAHRKAIIDILDEITKKHAETGDAALEDAIHRIIFPLNNESSDITTEMHNLWLVDERLNFHYMLASNKAFKKIRKIKSDSDERPDIMVILGDHKVDKSSSLIFIEIKRPKKNDYDVNNMQYHPHRQIQRYTKLARNAKLLVINESGREEEIEMQDKAPVYGYVIADLESNLREILSNDSFKSYHSHKNLEFMYKYDDDQKIFYYVLPYKTLLREAEERNKIFFKKLGLST